MLGEYKQAMHDGLRDLALRGEYRYFALMERAAGAFPDVTTWGMVPDFRKYYSKTIARTLEPVGLTREAVVWCSNDYLGMGQSDVVKRAMHEAIETYGAGAGGTRNIAGTTLLHDELEATLAELHGKEAALLFGSGFPANEAALSTFGRLFQTAAGVESDLQRCFADWETQHRIEEFSLGEHDTPSRLWIPEKLYGRETEIDTLLTAFDRIVARGRSELVLVSGYSGIGKSSVVNEPHRQLVPPRGLFASGKFDQYKRDISYATLAQAFQSLIRPLLSKSEAELRTWRNVLREALSIRRGHRANRPSSRIVPPCTVMRYETRTASTATERRAIETIHAGYLFNIASALNRPQGCRLRDMQRCMGAIAPTRSAQPTPPPRTTRKLGLQLWSVALGGIVPGVT